MLYAAVKALLRFIFFFLGLKSEGNDKLPISGPVIIAANHVSNWDPIVVALVLKRPIHFMGKAQLFKYRISDKFFTKLNAFPVKKGTPDRNAIRRALKVLEEGHVLGIFPEGARNKTGEEMKAQSGVAMIALKSGSPIVPVACIGTNCNLPWGWFRPLMVKVGDAIYLDEYQGQKVNSATLEQLSSDIMDKINQLL
ncbi:MAG: 1-acyl-sn-glycerol-3-phosphate acyltransferase [Firmicutes bacterium HGW-Firmicutes-15]|nr:MAG: 1-acyl-sn-glycerol-3-phosphate acyltransferase [Firmicutes bacterium HGW-Firmicutes-15]